MGRASAEGGSQAAILVCPSPRPRLPGCATLANTFEEEPKNKIYVGVRQDFTGWTFAHGGFIDWPFSLVLDTVLLPYTIPVTIRNYATAEDGESRPNGGEKGAM